MQFLVYLTILMVSISTVLLEVHWLTSPPPQPKPASPVAATPAPPPKIEGPSAALSPVYPKNPDASPPATDSKQQQPQQQAQQQSQQQSQQQPSPPQAQVSAAAAAPHATGSNTNAPEKPRAETTGVAARTDDATASSQPHTAASAGRCDIQACSSAYKSFRASDCTYQPFEGVRRVCEKPPIQRTAREQREEPTRRHWSRDIEPRAGDRVIKRQFDDDDDEDNIDSDDDSDEPLVIHRHGTRW